MPGGEGLLAPSPRPCPGCPMSAAASWRRPAQAEVWEDEVSRSAVTSSPPPHPEEPRLPAGKGGEVGGSVVLELAPTSRPQAAARDEKAPPLQPGDAFEETICVASGTEEPPGSDLHPGRTPSQPASWEGSRDDQHLRGGSSCPSS